MSTSRPPTIDSEQLFDDVHDWIERFVNVMNPDDLDIITLWILHTHLVTELRSTPRLMIGSIAPESGKTTLLDHMNRLCHNPVQAASMTPAVLPRILQHSMATVLLDEVDRALRPDKEGVNDLIAILNSGYRVGGARILMVKGEGGAFIPMKLPTFAPVAMAGNRPQLPDDTRSRSIQIIMMPGGEDVEETDWDEIEDEAKELHDRIAEWAETVREQVPNTSRVDLPAECKNRLKEKWKALKRVAVLGGERWAATADKLIKHAIAEYNAERESGINRPPIGVMLMMDLHAVWPQDKNFMSSERLANRLIAHNPEYWARDTDRDSTRDLNAQRLGKLIHEAAKVNSVRGVRNGPRGFRRRDLHPIWIRLGLPG